MPVLPQQKAIAEELNLSATTVSRSLRNHPSINAETRARVVEMAARIGYRIPANSRRARRTSDVETRYVGVLIAKKFKTYLRDASGAGYLAGLCEQADAQNLSLVVNYFDGSSARFLSPDGQTQGMRDGSTRGLVLIHQFDAEVVSWLAERWPVVTLTWDVPESRADHIDVNNAAGMLALVRHLHGFGHRRIGFIGTGRGVTYSYARYAGYAQALAKLGIAMDPAAVMQVTEPAVGWDELADRVALAVRQRGITAWMCDGDGPANWLQQRLMARGLFSPRDLSITGYDGSDSSPWMPRMTSFRVPFVEMGVAAIARLVERIDNPALLPRHTLLNGELISGETTGPVPAPLTK